MILNPNELGGARGKAHGLRSPATARGPWAGGHLGGARRDEGGGGLEALAALRGEFEADPSATRAFLLSHIKVKYIYIVLISTYILYYVI